MPTKHPLTRLKGTCPRCGARLTHRSGFVFCEPCDMPVGAHLFHTHSGRSQRDEAIIARRVNSKILPNSEDDAR